MLEGNCIKSQEEAAALQSWLVGNARNLRPLDQSGLMGWALAALRAQSDQYLRVETRAADLVEGLEDMDLPNALPARLKKLRDALNQPVTTLTTMNELRQQLADALHQRDTLGKAIGDAALKAGIVRDGIGLTGPQLLMLVDDLAECSIAASQQQAEVAS